MSHLGRIALAVFLAGAPALPGQVSPDPPRASVAANRTAEELDQLLAPIALYPDALIALILPATTAPADIVLAARHLRANGDLSQVESRSWEDSVKSLTRYPDVLRWLDDNLDWTKQVGEAFVAQPVDVMNAVQRLRAQARAAGTLVDTPQQQVISASGMLRIVPAQPDRIYVPVYDPSVIYLESRTYALPPPIFFGAGYPVGSWLAYECDWTQRKVWVGDRHRPWRGHDWRRPVVAPEPQQPRSRVTQWRAPVRPAHPASVWTGLTQGSIVQPNAFTTTPAVPALPAPQTYGRGRNRGSTSPAPGQNQQPANTVTRREYPGPRSIDTTPPLPVVPPITRAGQTGWTNGRSRSLPNTVSSLPANSAPPLPMTAPPLPSARTTYPSSIGQTLPSLPENIAPALPSAAPSLPAVVPTFNDPPGGAVNSPPDRAPRSRHTNRGQLD